MFSGGLCKCTLWHTAWKLPVPCSWFFFSCFYFLCFHNWIWRDASDTSVLVTLWTLLISFLQLCLCRCSTLLCLYPWHCVPSYLSYKYYLQFWFPRTWSVCLSLSLSELLIFALSTKQFVLSFWEKYPAGDHELCIGKSNQDKIEISGHRVKSECGRQQKIESRYRQLKHYVG